MRSRLDLQRIVRDFAPSQDSSFRIRFGEVTVVGSGTVDLTVGGSDVEITGVRTLKSYGSPVVGDTVVVITDGLDLVVLGALT